LAEFNFSWLRAYSSP